MKYGEIWLLNSSPTGQNGHFADDIFKCIFLNEDVLISIKIPLKFIPNGHISNIPALVQIMAWRRPGDKPLSDPMMANLLTHICVTRPQWVNEQGPCIIGLKDTSLLKSTSSLLFTALNPHTDVRSALLTRERSIKTKFWPTSTGKHSPVDL